MSSPPVTVIVPTRNRLAFLPKAVASVREQSFPDWELIVVDDCSQDGTWDWLGSLDDERIRPLRLEQHRERSAARNEGLRAARGEYVLFLDDDDWLLEGALANLFDALRQEPRAVGAVGAFLGSIDGDSWKRWVHPRRRHVRDVWPDLLFGWMPLQGQALLRRSAVFQAGGWNEAISLFEDYDLWLRLARLGPAVLIPQSVMACRLHAAQTRKADAGKVWIELSRRAVAGQSGEEKRKAILCIRARSYTWLAQRAYQHADVGRAAACAWRAIGFAPQMLSSPPIPDPRILPLALRCAAGAIVGRRALLTWRRCRKAVRENLQTGFLRRGREGRQKPEREKRYCEKKAREA